MADSRSDADLLAATDGDSFAEFYRRHVRQLAGQLMRSTGSAEVAADLVAETFAAALIARGRYRASEAAPATWLQGIAHHKLADWRRRGFAEDRARARLRMERLPLSDEDVHEIEYLGGDVSVHELLDVLPEHEQAALRDRYLGGRGYSESARRAGISEAAMRQRVSRGLAHLRKRAGGGT